MEEVYRLPTIFPDHSEKLFKMRLFGVNGEYPANHPAEASENILKKCGGIPLAIITMASLLVGKSRKDWFDVCNAPGFYHGSKGNNQQVDDTEWILSLSYYDLPSYLRTSLLYLSVYPEDREIEKDSLIWKWIAEGFVEKERGIRQFQRGEEYFNQLINRSMIQAVESDNYTGVVRAWQQDLKHLGNLLHLRYLGLQRTGRIGSELPEEIGKLKFLQTLDFESLSPWVLPSSICQLTQLVFVRGYISPFRTWVDGSFLGKVTSLEELRVRIHKLDEESQRQFMKNLGNLSEVRVLEIMCSWKEMVQSDLVQSLGNLHKLQHLQLTEDIIGGVATVEWDRVILSRHLQHLRLDAPLSLGSLGGMPELRYLELSTIWPSMACMATVANITAGDGFFKKLRRCVLRGWMVHLVVNKDSTGVSFSIWNGKGVMAFVSKAKDEYSRPVAPPPVMTDLQELWFQVPVRALYEDSNGGCNNLGLKCLPSLRQVSVTVDCEGASANDVEKAEAELWRAAQLHPKIEQGTL